MENLITIQYFQGQLSLPYVNIQGVTGTGTTAAKDKEQSQLERYITRYQKEYLTKIFGSEVVPSQIPATDLADEETLVSPIANYVFCKVLPFYASRSTMSGEKQKKSFESDNAGYQDKVCVIWNDMVNMNVDIREKLWDAGVHSTYPTDDADDIYHFKYIF